MKVINELYVLLTADSEADDKNLTIAKRRKKRWTNTLFFSSFGSLSIGFCGFAISGLQLFGVLEKNKPTSQFSAFMLLTAIGLLFFSAHALDKIREINKTEKKEKSQ